MKGSLSCFLSWRPTSNSEILDLNDALSAARFLRRGINFANYFLLLFQRYHLRGDKGMSCIFCAVFAKKMYLSRISSQERNTGKSFFISWSQPHLKVNAGKLLCWWSDFQVSFLCAKKWGCKNLCTLLRTYTCLWERKSCICSAKPKIASPLPSEVLKKEKKNPQRTQRFGEKQEKLINLVHVAVGSRIRRALFFLLLLFVLIFFPKDPMPRNWKKEEEEDIGENNTCRNVRVAAKRKKKKKEKEREKMGAYPKCERRFFKKNLKKGS